MSVIDTDWKGYFTNPHEGMGTTYERFILNRLLDGIVRHYGIRSLLEVPSFGMTGISDINSVWWARQGLEVTVVDHERERIDMARKIWDALGLPANLVCHDAYARLPFKDGAFDASWNFSALQHAGELEPFLEELSRVTRKVIFLCVPNRWGIGYLARRVAGEGRTSAAGDGNTDLRNISSVMRGLGWGIKEKGFFDTPPWPDIAMKKEVLLEKVGMRRLARMIRKKEDGVLCILDYYQGKNSDMEKEMMKYSFLEGSPWIIKRFWSHHQYAVFTPR